MVRSTPWLSTLITSFSDVAQISMRFVLLLRSAFGDHNVPHHSSIILLFGKSTCLFLFVANAHSNRTCGFELNLHDTVSYYSNRFGQVGTGSSAEQVLSLTKIETHFKPIQIACGDFHSAAVTVSQLPKRESIHGMPWLASNLQALLYKYHLLLLFICWS